jgi:transcription initiation factor TFIIIB Brf1 subunit/transcription initiation factor TFIIB
MFDDEEIRKAQEEEQRSPGQKSKTEKVEKKLLAEVRRAFRFGTEREFMQALRKIDISDESPRFAELLKLFRETRGPSRR